MNFEHQEGVVEENEHPGKVFQNWLKVDLETRLSEVETIPEEERSVERLGNYGYRWRVKKIDEIPKSSVVDPDYQLNNRSRSTEYFFDFDDTLFNTTAYSESIWSALENLGIPREQILALYQESKVQDPENGHKFYQPKVLINKLTAAFPNKSGEIENAFVVSNPAEFMKPEMTLLFKELSANKFSRVHILTTGERDYQMEKIKSVIKELGVPVDVLITQVPKAEFLRRYLPEAYPEAGESDTAQSFIVIDDRPEEIEELSKLSHDVPFLVPIRLRDASGKYATKDTGGEKSLETAERFREFLLRIKKRVAEIRRDKEITKKVVLDNEDVSDFIRKEVSSILSSETDLDFDVSQNSDGNLVIKRNLESFPGSGERVDIFQEIRFDDTRNRIIEISRNEDGKIIGEADFKPSYLDLADSS